jgi:hypothetical protein
VLVGEEMFRELLSQRSASEPHICVLQKPNNTVLCSFAHTHTHRERDVWPKESAARGHATDSMPDAVSD